MDNSFVIDHCYFPSRTFDDALEICKDYITPEISEALAEIEEQLFIPHQLIKVSNKADRLIHALKKIKEPSIEKIKQTLESFDSSFLFRPEQTFPLEAAIVDEKIQISYKNLDTLLDNRLVFHDLAHRIGIIFGREGLYLCKYTILKSFKEFEEDNEELLKKTCSLNLEENKKDYLSTWREIFEFSSEIYKELRASGLENKDVRRLFNYGKVGQESQEIMKQRSIAASDYLSLFEDDEEVLKKLFKDIYGHVIANTNYFKEDIY